MTAKSNLIRAGMVKL